MATKTPEEKAPPEASSSQTTDPTATDLCVWNLVDANQIQLLARLTGDRQQLLEHFTSFAVHLDNCSRTTRVGHASDVNRQRDTSHVKDLEEHLEKLKDLEKENLKQVDACKKVRKIFTEHEKRDSYAIEFIARYLLDWYQYAVARSFNAAQTSAILEIAYKSHAHFVESPVSTPQDTVEFFKRLMIIHSVDDLPRSMRVFSPVQCCDAVEYFVRDYVKAMPLVRFLHFPQNLLVDCPVQTLDAD